MAHKLFFKSLLGSFVVQFLMNQKPTQEQKIEQLLTERNRLQDKLNGFYKTFRGVRHEDSASEMKYTTIKVYEAHINSINEELRTMGVVPEHR